MNDNLHESERAPDKVTESGKASAPIKIWLVDDDQPLRSTLKDILNQIADFRCAATFHSPNAVLSALASRNGPDVILLDIQMGEACGLDAIRPIKALSRTTQVLMLTTCFDSQFKQRALADGASGFLLKYFSIEQIQAAIRQASTHPAPHLKCTRRPGWSPGSTEKSNRRKAGFLSQFVWLKQCLDIMPFRGN